MNKEIDIKEINEIIEKESAFIDILLLEINKVIVGQKHMIERLLIGLLGQGHILLEGVPGLAKTLAINSLSKAVKGSFSRIQFTPDLLPADVVGTMIYNMKENDFSIKNNQDKSMAFFFKASIETSFKVFSCVLFKYTGQPFPASTALAYQLAQTHQPSPSFKPGKPNSG